MPLPESSPLPAPKTGPEDYVFSHPRGQVKKLSILFADINGYTSFAEAVPPCEVFKVLSLYFSRMGQVVQQNQGRILDYFGDGFLACFGLEEQDCRQKVQSAVRAGWQMFPVLNDFNRYLQETYGRTFSVRVGIHHGEVIWGQIGIENMQKSAAIGDQVNLASRIEQANKQCGTSFLISQAARTLLGTVVQTDREFEIRVRGKEGLHKIYEVTGLRELPLPYLLNGHTP